MKIIDEFENELSLSQIDTNLGYFQETVRFVQHHDEIAAVPEKYHYEIQRFFFEDGTMMEFTSQDDPHIQVIDDQRGAFEYVDCGEGKVYKGGSVTKVIDEPAVAYHEAWDEYEPVTIFVRYTAQELREKILAEEEDKLREDFFVNGARELMRLKCRIMELEDNLAQYLYREDDQGKMRFALRKILLDLQQGCSFDEIEKNYPLMPQDIIRDLKGEVDIE